MTSPGLRVSIACCATVAVHASLICLAVRAQRSYAAKQQPMAALVETELVYDLPAKPPEPPPPPPEPERAQAPVEPSKHAAAPRPRPTAAQPEPQPSAAGTALVQEDGPVDLTADTIVVGAANTYAGGATSPTAPARDQPVIEPAAPSADHSSAVSLASERWSCPWPEAAAGQGIDEQTVVLRVFVAPEGHAQSVTIIDDPGHGFGPAAASCAMQTLFTPARDREGRAVRARSPPIRVRFTR